jgi:hypothetical protein
MADRVRLTERGFDPKTGTVRKVADPYTMNQDRRPGSEPAATKYENGNPDSWAETPMSEDIWKAEYSKGRNEVGMGNFLDDTWKDRTHPAAPGGKAQYENKTATAALKAAADDRAAELAQAKKIASKALNLAHAVFPKASEKFIFAKARDFMMMPESAIDSTINRIIRAGEETEEEDDKVEAKGKKAGDVPEAFKKQWEKGEGEDEGEEKKAKKKAGEEKEEEEKEEGKEASRSALASDIKRLESRLAALKKSVRTAGEETEEEKEEKEASLQMIASLERRLAALKTTLAGEEKKEEESEDEDKVAARLQAAAARLAGGEKKEEEEEEPAEEAKTAGEAEEPEEEKEEETKQANELDIELVQPSMETASEGDMLDDIFTAATKTASTKPEKKGVSKLGGTSRTASAGGTGGVDDLSRLWKSDPDVSGDFR